jgi:hypothetical protein
MTSLTATSRFLGEPSSDKLKKCMLNKRGQCKSRWNIPGISCLSPDKFDYQIACQFLNSDFATSTIFGLEVPEIK